MCLFQQYNVFIYSELIQLITTIAEVLHEASLVVIVVLPAQARAGA